MKKRTINFLLFFLTAFIAQVGYSQLVYSDGAVVLISGNCVVYSNGGVSLANNTDFTNDGELIITKSSGLAKAGDFEILSNSGVTGDGIYRVEQNWVNDATFNGGSSEVELNGNTEQFITSTMGVTTTFNNLTLTGTGTDLDRRKTLKDVNAVIGVNGILTLNDRELATETNKITVANPSPSAIVNSTTYEDEGFISSLPGGFLVKEMAVMDDYILPLGSSEDVRRYRPIVITTKNANAQSYAVRMNNFKADDEGFLVDQKEEKIESINELYYHTVEQLSGNTAADLAISFDTLNDTAWQGIADWEGIWTIIEGTNGFMQGGDYSFVQKTNWIYPTSVSEYILINTKDDQDDTPAEEDFLLDIPNVFTPNGDGNNDLFYVQASGIKDYKIQVVNRWGNLIYESNDYKESWNGNNLSGSECSPGTYFYVIEGVYKSDKIKEHGFITLVR